MAVPNWDHLLDQAGKLASVPSSGAPRQADLRRAVSTAYYAAFHFVLAAAADEFVGVGKRGTSIHTLAYRSIDHKTLRDLCAEVKKSTLPPKYRVYEPQGGFGAGVVAFATAMKELQERRHAADYDPSVRIRRSDAQLAIDLARSAIVRFGKASTKRRNAFLALLLFPAR